MTSGIKHRVAFIFNHSFFLGGGETSFFELIKTTDVSKIEAIAMVPARGEVQKRLESQNLACLKISLPGLKTIGVGLPLYAFIKLVFQFKKNRIDIIHVNGSRACFYAGLAGRILGIPVAWHVRESIRDRYAYDRFLAQCAHIIICVSGSVQRNHKGNYQREVTNIGNHSLLLNFAISARDCE